MCSLPILQKSDNHRLGWPQIVGWMPVQRVELGTMMRNHEFEETPWNFQLFSWWNLCFLCSVLLFGFLGVLSTGEGVCSNGFQLSIFLSQYVCGCLYKVAKECELSCLTSAFSPYYLPCAFLFQNLADQSPPQSKFVSLDVVLQQLVPSLQLVHGLRELLWLDGR